MTNDEWANIIESVDTYIAELLEWSHEDPSADGPNASRRPSSSERGNIEHMKSEFPELIRRLANYLEGAGGTEDLEAWVGHGLLSIRRKTVLDKTVPILRIGVYRYERKVTAEFVGALPVEDSNVTGTLRETFVGASDKMLPYCIAFVKRLRQPVSL